MFRKEEQKCHRIQQQQDKENYIEIKRNKYGTT